MRRIERALRSTLLVEGGFAFDSRCARFGSVLCVVILAHIFVISVVATLGGCRETAPPVARSVADQTRGQAVSGAAQLKDSEEHGLAKLGAWEEAERERLDVSTLPSFERISGSNPSSLVVLSKTHAAVLLRGDSRLLVVDGEGKTLSSVVSPPSPVAGVLVSDELWVVGEGSPDIWIYKVAGSELRLQIRLDVSGATSLRALAVESPERAFVADDFSGAILEVRRAHRERSSSPPSEGGRSRELTAVREIDRCHAPLALALHEGQLVAVCSSSHQLRRWDVRTKQASGAGLPGRKQRLGRLVWTPIVALPPITHDGPVWSVAFSRATTEQTPVVLLTGIENRPLDRSDQGSFGFIDSFIFAYRLPNGGNPSALASINVGEHGLITPKWIEGSSSVESSKIRVASYGGSKELTIRFAQPEFGGTVAIESVPILPGTTDHVSLATGELYANPLFDGLVVGKTDRRLTAIAATTPDARSTNSRIGELLFFTELMSPWASSVGRRSRFSCEACHFEGYVDGRTHYTGRRDVIATSRPLRGLFNNRPHFSRALDETSTEMVNNEFSVANKLNGRSPWFDIGTAELSWLATAVPNSSIPLGRLGPVELRQAFMVFLRDFTHRDNPAVRARTSYNQAEKRGASLFRDHCEACHSARTVSDRDDSRVAFEEWEKHLFSGLGSRIVWARPNYAKTGVEPYVHKKGARAPTLRRLYKKWPYFTNGSAKSLDEVLDRVRLAPGNSEEQLAEFSHAATSDRPPIPANKKADLLAFLRLL